MARVFARLAVAAAVVPLLAGCIVYTRSGEERVAVSVASGPTTVSGGPAETLKSARFEDGALIVRVESNGCTQVSDFAVSVRDGDPVEISLARTAADPCRALVPEGVELRWSYDELGIEAGQAARVLNPVRL